MGLFSGAPICAVCGEKCDFPNFKLGDGSWLCQDCLKDAGLSPTSRYNKMTVQDIKNNIIRHSENQKAAASMYRYAVDNDFGSGFNEKWGIKHFFIIQEHLLPGEKVLMTFIGLHNYQSATKHDMNFAYAVTNKRFVMAQKNTISGEKFQTVSLENINDITFKSGLLGGIIIIDTIKEVFNVYINKSSAKQIHNKILEILNDLKKGVGEQDSTQASEAKMSSTADEILKFKSLLDQGIITQEEFEEQKKKLLNL